MTVERSRRIKELLEGLEVSLSDDMTLGQVMARGFDPARDMSPIVAFLHLQQRYLNLCSELEFKPTRRLTGIPRDDVLKDMTQKEQTARLESWLAREFSDESTAELRRLATELLGTSPAPPEIGSERQYAKFGKSMWEFIVARGNDFCGEEISEDILPLAQAAGLCQRVKYDPAKHGSSIEADPGCEIWWWGTSRPVICCSFGIMNRDPEVRCQNSAKFVATVEGKDRFDVFGDPLCWCEKHGPEYWSHGRTSRYGYRDLTEEDLKRWADKQR